MDQLKGKVAVVTGAASGIGRSMARRFAKEGMHLVLADVEAVALQAVAESLAAGGTEVLAVPTDVRDRDAVDALADKARGRFGTFHVVCNNAGVGGHGYSTWESPPEEWDWVLGVNVMGVVNGLRAFVPTLVEQDEGHVVNTASAAGLGTMPFMGPYCASKHAVVAISEALFGELAFRGSAVRVSVLCPGFIRSGIMESYRNWPDALGTDPGLSQGDAGSDLVLGVFRAGVDAGLEPEVLAEAALEAVGTGRFMVTTHEDLARASLDGKLAELQGADPSLPGPA